MREDYLPLQRNRGCDCPQSASSNKFFRDWNPCVRGSAGSYQSGVVCLDATPRIELVRRWQRQQPGRLREFSLVGVYAEFQRIQTSGELGRHKLQAGGVHAVAQAGGLGAVVEDVVPGGRRRECRRPCVRSMPNWFVGELVDVSAWPGAARSWATLHAGRTWFSS